MMETYHEAGEFDHVCTKKWNKLLSKIQNKECTKRTRGKYILPLDELLLLLWASQKDSSPEA